MKVEPHPLTPTEVRERAEAWFNRQVETLKVCHGDDWPKVQDWLESYLKEQLRQRLIAIGWRPKG